MTRRRAHSAALLTLCLVAFTAHAAGIDASHPYAWSAQGGWVNFAPSQAAVTVTDSSLTGYAWVANDGWLNLSPTNGGVTNDGEGHLGGFAWDEALGWVSFTGVSVDSSGRFHGQATGANETITFDCTNCDVETDWRPSSSAGNSESGSRTDSGSTQLPTEGALAAPSPLVPAPPFPGESSSTESGPLSQAGQATSAPLGLEEPSGNPTSSPAAVTLFPAHASDAFDIAAALAMAILAVIVAVIVCYRRRRQRQN